MNSYRSKSVSYTHLGRFHYYEGHDMDIVTLPIRVFAKLGIQYLCVTNACGGIREDLNPGQITSVSYTHLNVMNSYKTTFRLKQSYTATNVLDKTSPSAFFSSALKSQIKGAYTAPIILSLIHISLYKTTFAECNPPNCFFISSLIIR